jgi:hypothetical protein
VKSLAIDGPKIIDSDLAYDIYNEFIDLYDSGMDVEDIKKKIEKWQSELFDDVEVELYITAYALALWETGNLTESILCDVKQSIEKGASIRMWEDGNDEKIAISRRKELNKFITKISIPKEQPRQRKKYKKISNYIFQIDDIVTFQAIDGNYYASILTRIDQYRGHCHYRFTPTDYCKKEKPIIKNIINGNILGNKIGSLLDKEILKYKQPGIEKLWKADKQFKISFIIGLETIGIEHKDLVRFSDMFEVIGNISLEDGYRELGSISYEDNFEEFSLRFLNQEENMKIFNFVKIPLKMVVK